MERTILKHLLEWKDLKKRKPMLLRGARQVGKSWLVKKLGESFPDFVEINFESRPLLKKIFDEDLTPDFLIPRLSAAVKKPIIPGKTLLFFDEIQQVPNALTSLRYFYEEMPDLHVIAAGSLLEFVIEKIGIPVGRVESLYCYPLSFYEFMIATGNEQLAELIKNIPENVPLDEPLHKQALTLLSEYMAVGGMPEAVAEWVETKNIMKSLRIHKSIIDTYRQDFGKYAKNRNIEYVDLVFNAVPHFAGKKFVFSHVSDSIRSRELKPALELLQKAGVVHKICHSSGNGIPVAAEENPALFKVIPLDIGLMQAALNINYSDWLVDPELQFINKGAVTEAFAGMEILAYSWPFERKTLHYWVRENHAAKAEVDYLIEKNGEVIPVEVKSGGSNSLKSIELFLKEKKKSSYGLHISPQPAGLNGKIKKVPLYAIWNIFDKTHNQ